MHARLTVRHFGVVLVYLTLVGVTLALGSCATTTTPSSATQRGSTANPTAIPLITYHPKATVTYGASWAIFYYDLKSLKRAADLNVEGTISAVSAVTRDQDGLVSTDFVFTVKTTLLDSGHRLNGSPVIIHQTGGMVGTTLYQIEDDPLFQVGEQAILFLHEYSPGHYFVIGGPSGRFRVQNGQVSPMNNEGVVLGAPLSEAAFISKVQQA